VVGALSFIVRFCGGQTDLNNNKIPDNKELIEKMKLYLDTLKVNNEGNMKKKEYKANRQMLQKILKIKILIRKVIINSD
jgi:hypothetical protein